MKADAGHPEENPSPAALRARDALRALWGCDPAGDGGVLHVTSAWRDPRGPWRVLRIGPRSPQSPRDRLALGATRARADWILTTGRILRAEPGLCHGLHPEPARDAELRAWRRECAGRTAPPRSAVLSRGAGLDPEHPLFAADPPPLLLLPAGASADLPAALRRRCQVVELPRPGIREALAWLVDAGRAAAGRPAPTTVAIEAGPETANPLYRDPCAIDELLLSLWEGPRPSEGLAGALPSAAEIEAALGPVRGGSRVQEARGAWTFLRFRRSAGRSRPAGLR